ncbi:GNAT family N-acetyltransferase [Pedobacter yulinensis]|uniref:GNAT family N-acetyltransferase n=1 Tax=Pedobacter yulinensis TaxID=2126353 RepID=A0A2T3HR66_9SPHI|nr:GNAT family N-acetyltransferase [Pedobacter yulinensis]PST84955.1 GNAT family N-acetyltransferase [Pedobacter yulinensis]
MNRTLQLADVQVRTDLQAGDLGYIAYLHGQLYRQECGYGLPFEKYVLQGLAELAAASVAGKDRVWVCEHEGGIVGSLAGVQQQDGFQLRFFILLPAYRGIGLGKKLLDLFLAFMQERGYKKAYLWTTNEQLQAVRLYEKAGFCLAEEKPSAAFGKSLVELRYDLVL